jgi:hypothetical protein
MPSAKNVEKPAFLKARPARWEKVTGAMRAARQVCQPNGKAAEFAAPSAGTMP